MRPSGQREMRRSVARTTKLGIPLHPGRKLALESGGKGFLLSGTLGGDQHNQSKPNKCYKSSI